ncbi:hypothetical protein BHM03_00038004 [Ensete ventricosum]|nr:hypothetical protein BHM03_00038004 [Ensete ventricosum]
MKFVEGIGKLIGNMPRDYRKKIGRLTARMPEAVELAGITSKEEEVGYLDLNHSDALVVSRRMIDAMVKRVLIDIRSSVDIL